jgi:hypothetical protein
MKLLRFIKILFSDIGCALREHVWPNVAFFITLTGIFWVVGAIANLVSSTYSKWILTHVSGPDYGTMNSIMMYISIGAFTFMFLIVLALIPLSIYTICAKIKEYWNKA